MNHQSGQLPRQIETYFHRDTVEERRRVSGKPFSNPSYGTEDLTKLSEQALRQREQYQSLFIFLIGHENSGNSTQGFTYTLVPAHESLMHEKYNKMLMSKNQAKRVKIEVTSGIAPLPGKKYVHILQRNIQGYLVAAVILPKKKVRQSDLEESIGKILSGMEKQI